MSKFAVPSAPQVELKPRADQKSGDVRASASKTLTPLDAAFLSRIYRSMLWFGLAIVILTASGVHNAAYVSSVAAGLVLAAVLLRAQEIGVRALMRPQEQLGGFDTRLILLFLLPLKFLGLGVMLYALNYFGLIAPALLAVGFFAGQLVIVAKVVGWMMTRAARK